MPTTDTIARGTAEAARNLQRHGLTLTEIAATLHVERDAIVRTLYWDAIAGPEYVAPEIEPARLAYAGRVA